MSEEVFNVQFKKFTKPEDYEDGDYYALVKYKKGTGISSIEVWCGLYFDIYDGDGDTYNIKDFEEIFDCKIIGIASKVELEEATK